MSNRRFSIDGIQNALATNVNTIQTAINNKCGRNISTTLTPTNKFSEVCPNFNLSTAGSGNYGGNTVCWKLDPTQQSVSYIHSQPPKLPDGSTVPDSAAVTSKSLSPSDPKNINYINSWFATYDNLSQCGFGNQVRVEGSSSPSFVSCWNNMNQGNRCGPEVKKNSLSCITDHASRISTTLNSNCVTNPDKCDFGLNPQNMCKSFITSHPLIATILPLNQDNACINHSACTGSPTCRQASSSAECLSADKKGMCSWNTNCVNTDNIQGTGGTQAQVNTYYNLFQDYKCGNIVPGDINNIMPQSAFPPSTTESYNKGGSAGCNIFLSPSVINATAPTKLQYLQETTLKDFVNMSSGSTGENQSDAVKQFIDMNKSSSFEDMFTQYYNISPSRVGSTTWKYDAEKCAKANSTSDPSCVDPSTTLLQACANKTAADMEIIPNQCANLVKDWGIVPFNCNNTDITNKWTNSNPTSDTHTYLCPQPAIVKGVATTKADYDKLQYTAYFPPSVPNNVIDTWNTYKCGQYVAPTANGVSPGQRQHPQFTTNSFSMSGRKVNDYPIIDCGSLVDMSVNSAGIMTLSWAPTSGDVSAAEQCANLTRLHNLNKGMPNKCKWLVDNQAFPCSGTFQIIEGDSSSFDPGTSGDNQTSSPSSSNTAAIVGGAIGALVVGALIFLLRKKRNRAKVAPAMPVRPSSVTAPTNSG